MAGVGPYARVLFVPVCVIASTRRYPLCLFVIFSLILGTWIPFVLRSHSVAWNVVRAREAPVMPLSSVLMSSED
jgi:hypothetical protein